MYDMFFREWWNEYYGASESRQHRDVFKHCNALHLGQKIHPATRLCAKDVIRLFCGRAMALSRPGLSIWQVAAVVIMSNRESYWFHYSTKVPLRIYSRKKTLQKIQGASRWTKSCFWKIHGSPGCWIETSYLTSGSRRWLNLWTKPKPNQTKKTTW